MNQAHAIDTAKMKLAFSLVDPSCGGAVPGTTWRDEINVHGTHRAFYLAFAHHGLTLEDVLEAIRFYTATEPKVSRETAPNGTEFLRITADGYRKGPAGP